MFKFFKKMKKKRECAICHQKPEDSLSYYNDQGEKIDVCYKCIPYAERRAFRRA